MLFLLFLIKIIYVLRIKSRCKILNLVLMFNIPQCNILRNCNSTKFYGHRSATWRCLHQSKLTGGCIDYRNMFYFRIQNMIFFKLRGFFINRGKQLLVKLSTNLNKIFKIKECNLSQSQNRKKVINCICLQKHHIFFVYRKRKKLAFR